MNAFLLPQLEFPGPKRPGKLALGEQQQERVRRRARRRARALALGRRLVPWLVCALALLAWWLWLAPAQVGGQATYVVVSGTSMQPMLHTGDVVIARDEWPYAVGDLVVLQLSTGLVIHRLVDGDAKSGWTTRGDHNTWDDPWVLRDDQVLGRAWATVPRGGDVLAWVSLHPIATGALIAVLGLIPYLPWRRRRVTPELAALLAASRPLPREHASTPGETAVLAISAASTAVAMGLVVTLGVVHELVSSRGLLVLVALGWSAACTWWLAGRRYDGHGLPEPQRSRVALSGRLREVDELPEVESTAVGSAVELRSLAERERLPVLTSTLTSSLAAAPGSADLGVAAGPAYLVLTARRGAFVWQPLRAVTAPAARPTAPRLTGMWSHFHHSA